MTARGPYTASDPDTFEGSPEFTIPVPTGRVVQPPATPPPSRPCPRCGIRLVHQRSFTSKGLTGVPSVEHRFACPACDAIYRWSSRDQRWKELS